LSDQNDTSIVGQGLQLFDAGSALPAIRQTNEQQVQAVWDAYQVCHPQARLDQKRRKAITARLADGYTPEQLIMAIHGCHNDPWYRGENERGKSYCELTLILRDADHVDRFIQLHEAPRVPSSVNGRDVARMTGGSSGSYLAAFAQVAR
jgi:hypothetical protein